MIRNTPVNLVTESFTQDAYGVYKPTETKKKIYAQITSVSGAEWFEGGRIGLNPEFRARIYSFEYNGEEILEKDGVRYRIYRTYQPSTDVLELYCEKRKGAQAVPEPVISQEVNGNGSASDAGN